MCEVSHRGFSVAMEDSQIQRPNLLTAHPEGSERTHVASPQIFHSANSKKEIEKVRSDVTMQFRQRAFAKASKVQCI